LSTQVPVGVADGLKHESAIRCDELVSILKSQLHDYIGLLSGEKLEELNKSLGIALGIDS
jgi:mRNA interferase MazF